MNIIRHPRLVSFVLCGVLMTALALALVGCDTHQTPADTSAETTLESATETVAETVAPTVLGTGNTVFTFTVVDGEGEETVYEIHTDKTIVGEALLELGLIEGEDGPYGLYVKAVGGIRADYDKDGTYWAFYQNNKYAPTGVDLTTITPGVIYSFRVEKG
ncbi:MAG: DUF4430 domain-containing protein [Clostridia bacterium]|nr:DUF4430 domain-containing protein [Clostridia bacterium]